MVKSIPPWTVLDKRRKKSGGEKVTSRPTPLRGTHGVPMRSMGRHGSGGIKGGVGITRRGTAAGSGLEPAPRRTPKEWIYETKPVFKRVKEPLVDVFKEAEEVRIIIDLGSFRRGEIDIDIKPDKYIITAIHGKEVFKEEIALPEDVDIDNTEEHFKNGILELVLPKKRPAK